MNLHSRPHPVHHISVAFNSAAGIGVPIEAVKSRYLTSLSGFFVARVPPMAAGRRESQDSPVPHRYANLRPVVTRLASVGDLTRPVRLSMTNNTLPTVATFDGTDLTIIDRDGTPWVSAADLARALGYADDRAVSRIYRMHADEFPDAMSSVVETTTLSNLPIARRIFSPRGCHLIAMFARTARAAAFRRWVLDVLEGIAAPAPRAPKMVTKQQHDLPAPSAFNAELQERIYKRAGALSGLHYTWCVEQMNLQRHLPPVCFNPDTWTPEPHTTDVVNDLEAALRVMEVFGKRLGAHHRHLVKLTAHDSQSLSGMVAAAKAKRAQS